jgi:EAL domain-containing protein (putative c-di-GMP-specific phosphodiesterase class I)
MSVEHNTLRGPLVDLASATIDDVLELARTTLDMDVAFVGRLAGGRRTYRNVSAEAEADAALLGTSDAAEDTYCARIADGRLAPVVPDTSAEPLVRELAVTRTAGIGAHIGVPIRLSSGELYGTLCCFSHAANAELSPRDGRVLRLLAGLIALRIEDEHRTQLDRRRAEDRVTAALDAGQPRMVFQPIASLATGRVVGYESLARFDISPALAPEAWFALAEQAGMGVQLEAAAVRNAMAVRDEVPDELTLTINASARGICHPLVLQALGDGPLDGIIIELTEHELHDEGTPLAASLAALRARGARMAVDDVGAGYASLQRVLRLSPEIMKLDRALITGIDTDPAKQALVEAASRFAQRVGAVVVVEGVETAAELGVLAGLGVSRVQGYLVGRPGEAPWADMPPDGRVLPEPPREETG